MKIEPQRKWIIYLALGFIVLLLGGGGVAIGKYLSNKKSNSANPNSNSTTSQGGAGGSSPSSQVGSFIKYLDDTDAVNKNITNLVVIMLENRSFDHILGSFTMKDWPELNGLTGKENYTLPIDKTEYSVTPAQSRVETQDPFHAVNDVTVQIYGKAGKNYQVGGKKPTNNGFTLNAYTNSKNTASQLSRAIYSYHTDSTAPVIRSIANDYGIVDEWFSSVPGPTYPNRHFLNCATAHGLTDNLHDPSGGIPCKTIFHKLSDNDISWKVYNQNKRYECNVFRYSEMKERRFKQNVVPFQEFLDDAKNGSLPRFSYIDPDMDTGDYHPPRNLPSGENFLKTVYDAVRSGPQWEKTLFLIVFDEHGGFYDHVPPPTNVPIPDNSTVYPQAGDFQFERLGLRVPAILVSPWIKKGQIFRSAFKSRNFEHSSVSATINKFFGIGEFLTKRDEWAVSFHSSVNYLTSPRKDCLQNAAT
ncbi:hypothetical protein HDV01_003969 [Terramyces sp. JEL0728]|nr:hypothetical protein HDV01_003969 [Terramyces sp. JEL0728]